MNIQKCYYKTKGTYPSMDCMTVVRDTDGHRADFDLDIDLGIGLDIDYCYYCH